jgi:hypothetical protein
LAGFSVDRTFDAHCIDGADQLINLKKKKEKKRETCCPTDAVHVEIAYTF